VHANDRQELAVRLQEFMRRVSAHSAGSALAVADDAGLSTGDLRAALLLSRAGAPLSISDVAGRLGASQPTASRLVGSLSRRGFVLVEPASHDRRARRVELSPAGHALLERLRAARVNDVRPYVDGLSDELAERLSETLAALEPAGATA
jgi:DNA-binding MarR family transcriptional regulator